MTPTEAIRHLGAISAFANADEVKAVDMAIEALKDYAPTVTLCDPNDPSVPPVSFRNGRQVEPPLNPRLFQPGFSDPMRITRNAIECNRCGETIESWHEHDYKQCKCRSCSVDGGLNQLRRSGDERSYIERSEWA
jgi:hypothetical protein